MPHFKDSSNKLYWLDDGVGPSIWLPQCVKITEQEAAALSEGIQEAAFEALSYEQKRLMEYPPMADYLDGLVKNDQVQIQKYITDCLAVKAKYPKPD